MLSRKQEAFLRDDLKRINLLYGSVRSGKTYISLLKWALWVGSQNPQDEFLMVGKTITTLKRNCLGLLEQLIGNNISYSISQKKALIFGHAVWLEGASDERAESKIRGMTLKGAYVDELTQIPKDFYLMLLSRLSLPNSSLIATTNPDSPNHYVKTDIIDNNEINKQVVKFLLDDNIFIDNQYKEELKKEYSLSKVHYSRFILGEFVRAEGIIFIDIADNPKKYTVKQKDLPKFKYVGGAYDLGGNISDYGLLTLAQGVDGVIYVLKAKRQSPQGLKPKDVEDNCKKFIEYVEKKYNVRQETCLIDDSYYTTINALNGWRYIFGNACNIKGTMPLFERPIVLSKLMAQGRFKLVEHECDDLLDTLQNMVYDERSEKAIPLDDGSMSLELYDCLFYALSEIYFYLFD